MFAHVSGISPNCRHFGGQIICSVDGFKHLRIYFNQTSEYSSVVIYVSFLDAIETGLI